MDLDHYIASLPIEEVENQLDAGNLRTPRRTVLEDLRRRGQGINTSKESYKILHRFVEHAQTNSVNAMLVWRYVQEYQLWKTHPVKDMRSREAFAKALGGRPGFHRIIEAGAATHRWRRSTMLRNDSATAIASDDPVAGRERMDTHPQSAASAQELVNNGHRPTNDLATLLQAVIACLIFMPNVPVETGGGFFSYAKAIKINSAAPRHMRGLLRTQDSVFWGPLPKISPEMDGKLSPHFDGLVHRGANHLDCCFMPIIANPAEQNPVIDDPPVEHIFDYSRHPVFRFVTGTLNLSPHYGSCCERVRSVLDAIDGFLSPDGP